MPQKGPRIESIFFIFEEEVSICIPYIPKSAKHKHIKQYQTFIETMPLTHSKKIKPKHSMHIRNTKTKYFQFYFTVCCVQSTKIKNGAIEELRQKIMLLIIDCLLKVQNLFEYGYDYRSFYQTVLCFVLLVSLFGHLTIRCYSCYWSWI